MDAPLRVELLLLEGCPHAREAYEIRRRIAAFLGDRARKGEERKC